MSFPSTASRVLLVHGCYSVCGFMAARMINQPDTRVIDGAVLIIVIVISLCTRACLVHSEGTPQGRRLYRLSKQLLKGKGLASIPECYNGIFVCATLTKRGSCIAITLQQWPSLRLVGSAQPVTVTVQAGGNVQRFCPASTVSPQADEACIDELLQLLTVLCSSVKPAIRTHELASSSEDR